MPKDEKGVHLLADYDYLDTWKVFGMNSLNLWSYSKFLSSAKEHLTSMIM